MKKFVNLEANYTVELAIDIESYIAKLEKMFDSCQISVEDYIARRKKVSDLIDKNKELINNWKEDVSVGQ